MSILPTANLPSEAFHVFKLIGDGNRSLPQNAIIQSWADWLVELGLVIFRDGYGWKLTDDGANLRNKWEAARNEEYKKYSR